jgi:single-strand DNA-binding protein
MRGLADVWLIGTLTRNPELKQLDSGTELCELGLAVNECLKRGDEWIDRANFFEVRAWGHQGENCVAYLSKGSPVAVRGRLRQERWQTPDGAKRSKVVVVAEHVLFLSSGPRPETPPNEPDTEFDDPPF